MCTLGQLLNFIDKKKKILGIVIKIKISAFQQSTYFFPFLGKKISFYNIHQKVLLIHLNYKNLFIFFFYQIQQYFVGLQIIPIFFYGCGFFFTFCLGKSLI